MGGCKFAAMLAVWSLRGNWWGAKFCEPKYGHNMCATVSRQGVAHHLNAGIESQRIFGSWTCFFKFGGMKEPRSGPNQITSKQNVLRERIKWWCRRVKPNAVYKFLIKCVHRCQSLNVLAYEKAKNKSHEIKLHKACVVKCKKKQLTCSLDTSESCF